MSELLVKLFIKDSENIKSAVVRERYGMLSSVTGIVLNILLSAGKYLIGVITNSIAITADATNNLTDATSCIITLAGFKMANRKPDKEHPFGHGRIEYVAALIVGFLVELMGYELIKSSIGKIKNPEAVVFSIPAVIVLVMSILGKVWLAYFNHKLGKKIESPVMSAVVTDSIGDITATSVTLISLILSKFISFPLDGYMGILVSLFILYSGFGILKESIGIILGAPPSKEMVDELVDFIMSHEEILGIHDLVIHSYGASRTFATVHTEISSDDDIIKIHDTIDMIEKNVKDRFGIELVIHMDPIVTNNETVNKYYEMVHKVIKDIDSELNMHDFRVVEGNTHTNLIFDVVVPFGFRLSEKELIEKINSEIKKINENYYLVITVDNCYI
ncbi:MAG: cation diffusion facilitator family transporter [Oscillospiraceae bacterium]|nr:cation diffusion facilitator family transporter [Oscillospiraceae bacterium]MDD6145991.1 cation diffusion facilitator family transporter [Oscillospiraceae bacterium]